MTEPTKRSRSAVNKIFGDELPEVSPRERDDQAAGDADERDRWLRENIPPHHG